MDEHGSISSPAPGPKLAGDRNINPRNRDHNESAISAFWATTTPRVTFSTAAGISMLAQTTHDLWHGWAKNHDVHGREDQEYHRKQHLNWCLMRQLFRALPATNPHLP